MQESKVLFNSLARWTPLEKCGKQHGKVCKEKGKGMVREGKPGCSTNHCKFEPWKREI